MRDQIDLVLRRDSHGVIHGHQLMSWYDVNF